MGVMGAGGGSAFLTPPHHDHQFIIAFAAEVPRSDAGRSAGLSHESDRTIISRSHPAAALTRSAGFPSPPSPLGSRSVVRRTDTETGLIR